MDQLGNLIRLCWLIGFILCPKQCSTRRLDGSNSHPWHPLTLTSHKRANLKAFSAHQAISSNKQGSDNLEDKDMLAARILDNDDTVAIPERALGGVYTAIPYQAGILYRKHFRCGAAFVKEKNTYFFLTAASCVAHHFGGSYTPDTNFNNFEFFVGATDIRNIDPDLKYKPDKIVIHPCYNPTTNVGNLAVVFVPDFIHQIEGKIEAARLPLEEGYPFPIDVTASGFGGERRGTEAYGLLNKLDIGAWDQSFCRNFGWQPGLFCVVDMQPSRPRGVCEGDQGGPVIGEYEPDIGENFDYVAGIISHVPNELVCQTKGVPALVTQVSLYLPFIIMEVTYRPHSPYERDCVPVDCSRTEC